MVWLRARVSPSVCEIAAPYALKAADLWGNRKVNDSIDTSSRFQQRARGCRRLAKHISRSMTPSTRHRASSSVHVDVAGSPYTSSRFQQRARGCRRLAKHICIGTCEGWTRANGSDVSHVVIRGLPVVLRDGMVATGGASEPVLRISTRIWDVYRAHSVAHAAHTMGAV